MIKTDLIHPSLGTWCLDCEKYFTPDELVVRMFWEARPTGEARVSALRPGTQVSMATLHKSCAKSLGMDLAAETQRL